MMRALAAVVLRLYPKAWRRRYAEEVMAVTESRPVRLRTVADLARGAFDARLHHGRVRIPTAALLTAGAMALVNLWNPGIRQVSSLNGTWSRALEHGFAADLMMQVATVLFVMAPFFGLLALAPLLVTAAGAIMRREQGTAVVVFVVGVLLASLALVVGALFAAMAFFDVGFPMGRLGNAMTGGFFVPIMLALVLPIPVIASADPVLAHDVRSTGRLLAVAAALNALGWAPIGVVLVLGRSGASAGFVLAVAASAGCSILMSALVARSAIARGRLAIA